MPNTPPPPVPLRSIERDVRCLIVTDIDAMRAVTANLLRQIGVEQVRSARNGAEALAALQTQDFDTVLSEWHLPDMTGLELLQTIRADEQIARVPVLLTPSELARTDVQAAISAGVSAMLLKPYSAKQLQEAVGRTLAARRPARPRPGLLATLAANRAGQDAAANPVEAPAGTASAAEAVEAADAAASAPRADQPSILVIDDVSENLQLMAHLLQPEFHVQLASSGAQGLELTRSGHPPDLVLLDAMMPKMDGFEVAQRMREQATSAVIPIIFVTALDSAEARAKGLELGAVDVITKPIDLSVLRSRVRNLLAHTRLRAQLQHELDSQVEQERLQQQIDAILRQDIQGPLVHALEIVRGLMSAGDASREQMDAMRMAERRIEQAAGIVALTPDVQAIETGHAQPQLETLPIAELVRTVVANARMTFASKQLSVTVEGDAPDGVEPPLAQVDPRWCLTVLQSLLDTVCAAAPPAGRVEIRLFDETPLRIVTQSPTVLTPAARRAFFDRQPNFEAGLLVGMRPYVALQLLRGLGGEMVMNPEDMGLRLTTWLPRAPTEAGQPAAASQTAQSGTDTAAPG